MVYNSRGTGQGVINYGAGGSAGGGGGGGGVFRVQACNRLAFTRGVLRRLRKRYVVARM